MATASQGKAPAASSGPAKAAETKGGDKPESPEKGAKSEKDEKKEKLANVLVNIQVDEKQLGREAEAYYPYKKKMAMTEYMDVQYQLQIECSSGRIGQGVGRTRHGGAVRGRDAAGKGGTIKRFMEHLNPRPRASSPLVKPNGSRTHPVVLSALSAFVRGR